MSSYWISFRIHDNSTYQKRLAALTSEIDNISSINWRETTSFHLIETTMDIGPLSSKLKAQIDPTVDKIVLRKIAFADARYIGKVQNVAELLTLMPYIKAA